MKKLFLYSALTNLEWRGWFADAKTFRLAFPKAQFAVRVCPDAMTPPPNGYELTGTLAHHGAVRVPTVRDFVSALSPKAVCA